MIVGKPLKIYFIWDFLVQFVQKPFGIIRNLKVYVRAHFLTNRTNKKKLNLSDQIWIKVIKMHWRKRQQDQKIRSPLPSLNMRAWPHSVKSKSVSSLCSPGIYSNSFIGFLHIGRPSPCNNSLIYRISMLLYNIVWYRTSTIL